MRSSQGHRDGRAPQQSSDLHEEQLHSLEAFRALIRAGIQRSESMNEVQWRQVEARWGPFHVGSELNV